jgi:hypothetical protein
MNAATTSSVVEGPDIGTFANPYDSHKFYGPAHEFFHWLVTEVNIIFRRFNHGNLSTSILTSYALVEILRQFGCEDQPGRVEAAVFPDDLKCCGTILGSTERPQKISK